MDATSTANLELAITRATDALRGTADNVQNGGKGRSPFAPCIPFGGQGTEASRAKDEGLPALSSWGNRPGIGGHGKNVNARTRTALRVRALGYAFSVMSFAVVGAILVA